MKEVLHEEKIAFVERFVEVCGGTTEPAKVQRLLNISYQAAKNYLLGRVPDPHVLLLIAAKTPYSLHWLLTGQGSKFVFEQNTSDAVLTNEMRDLIKVECMRAVQSFFIEPDASGKKIVLPPSRLMSEKPRVQAAVPDKED